MQGESGEGRECEGGGCEGVMEGPAGRRNRKLIVGEEGEGVRGDGGEGVSGEGP